MEAVTDFLFLGSKSLWMVTAAMKLKEVCFLEGLISPDSLLKSKGITADKALSSQSFGLSSTHVWILRVGP